MRFDRSFWNKKFSGSTGAQLMAGLRFLGLLKGNTPQTDLETLVKAKGEGKRAILARIFKQAYTTVDFDALRRATPSMLAEWFRAYNLEGHTLRKAESFFINGCKSVDIPLSNALRKKARYKPLKSAAVVARDRKRDREKGAEESPKLPGTLVEGYRGQINKVTLVSGGEVTLAIDVDLFQLSREDRDFVLKLVDIMNGYADSLHK